MVVLKDISGLRFALHKGEFLSQPGEGASSTGVAVALWVVTSTLRRDGVFPADKLSQLNRADKAPVGLMRAVEEAADGKLKLEVWFLEACIEASSTEEADAASSGEAAAGQGTIAGVPLEDQNADADLGSEILPAQMVQRRGRKRRRRGSGRGRGYSRPTQGRSGRISRPTARAVAAWSSDDEGPNLFSQLSTDAGQQSPPEAHPHATSGAAVQSAPIESQSPLHACLLADSSPQPVPVPNVRMSLQGHAASPARAALLLVDCERIVAPLCHPKRVQGALGAAVGEPPLTPDKAAIAVGLAMVLAEEQSSKGADAGVFHIQRSSSSLLSPTFVC